MRAQMLAAVRAVFVLTVLCGVLYPLTVAAAAQIAFDDEADGSLVEHHGQLVGSSLIGQAFDGDEWFHPRPSAAGDGYDAAASAASNLGPTNGVFLDTITERVREYRDTNQLDDDVAVPVDAVTASGSGLDPHISVANAWLQAARVADTRGVSLDTVVDLVNAHTETPSFGFLGETRVNVLELNIALDGIG